MYYKETSFVDYEDLSLLTVVLPACTHVFVHVHVYCNFLFRNLLRVTCPTQCQLFANNHKVSYPFQCVHCWNRCLTGQIWGIVHSILCVITRFPLRLISLPWDVVSLYDAIYECVSLCVA